jgi:anti-anti-sigma regulatory factor
MKFIKEAPPGTLRVSGSLHTTAVGPLREALLKCLSAQSEVAVDLTGVDMCDTASLQVLFACQSSAASQGKTLRVTASPAVRETLEALGLPQDILEAASHGS